MAMTMGPPSIDANGNATAYIAPVTTTVYLGPDGKPELASKALSGYGNKPPTIVTVPLTKIQTGINDDGSPQITPIIGAEIGNGGGGAAPSGDPSGGVGGFGGLGSGPSLQQLAAQFQAALASETNTFNSLSQSGL